MTNATGLFLGLFCILLAGALSAIFLLFYNLLVRKEEKANEAWAQVAVLLQRKADLIPALMSACEGYSRHENDLQRSVASERGRFMNAIEAAGGISLDKAGAEEFIRADRSFGASILKAIGLTEKYPELKADIHYTTLQHELAHTENSIAAARKQYNLKVGSYNTVRNYFPANIVAAIFKFEEKIYYEKTY